MVPPEGWAAGRNARGEGNWDAERHCTAAEPGPAKGEDVCGLDVHRRMVTLGFATEKEMFDRVVGIMRTNRLVSLPEVFSAIACEWGMDQNGQFLRIRDFTREQLQKLNAHYAGNIRWLADTLGVDRGSIYYHLGRCGIDRSPVEERKRRPPRKRNGLGKKTG
jgi:hypothetical protein